ncbi:MAG TPA: type III pantothenate kinase [Candidatus Obscuribacterales bacterium]
MTRIIVDVGNSRISIASSGNGHLSVMRHYDTNDAEAAADYIVAESGRLMAPVAFASVVPQAREVLVTKLTESGRTFHEITTANQGIIHSVYPSMGVDRIACIAAALRFHGQGKGAIVLDFGTATTFTACDENGTFKGGWITLGLGRTLKALNRNTGQLPDLADKLQNAQDVLLGFSTENAILSGTLLGHVGIVSEWVSEFRKQTPGEYRILATGGYAPMVMPLTDLIDAYEPDLALKGIDLIAEAAAVPEGQV